MDNERDPSSLFSAPLPRRRFLKQAGAGAALLLSRPLLSLAADSSPSRTAPAQAVTLRSSQLEIVLDAHDGLPFRYQLKGAAESMQGAATTSPMLATVARRSDGSFFDARLLAPTVKSSSAEAHFRFTVRDDSRPAVAFTVRYALQGATLWITLEDVQEQPGYELIEVASPSLVTIRPATGAKPWLAHGESGGSLALLDEAKEGTLETNTFWGKVLATLPVLILGSGRTICIQEITAYMDGAELTVAGEGEARLATMGSIRTHRIHGGRCQDMNTGPGTPRNCGDAKTPNLLVEQRPTCRVDFLAGSGDPAADWITVAKSVRERMPRIPNHYYDDKVVYGIRCDEPTWEKPGATFAECKQLIARVAAITDKAPQVVHLWGWQYRGKDTGYPAVAEVDARLGGYDAMMRLMEEARSLNANVTLSDNYDDAYRSSPAWSDKIVARRPDGELWKSRNWTGEDSYVLGMAKYAEEGALERVRYTCERYRLRESTHVDVLSYFPIRNDWDREHPASGIRNLEARYRIFDEFAHHGVDVSSEALRYPFIGKMSCFWYMQGPRPCPFGGTAIPLLPLIYRKSALWGQSGSRGEFIDRLLVTLFYNGCGHMIVRSDMTDAQIADYYYLMMVPWLALRGRNIEGFHREREQTRIELEGSAVIDIDWARKSYSVKLAGEEVSWDQALAWPIDRDRVAFYAIEEKTLTASLPSGWSGEKPVAFALTSDSREPVALETDGNKMQVRVQPRRPVMVYRNAMLAGQRAAAASGVRPQ